ncbi:MAG: crossover junction endodeoxyribonuclease RuvC [Chitinophagaceae bacterium]
MSLSSKIILGIDPGSLQMGYAVLQTGRSSLQVLEMDTLKMSGRNNAYTRLQLIHEKVSAIIETYRPDCLAIEAPFFGKNVQSMLKLGRAQGIAIGAALQKNLPIFEYAPRRVKQAITGNGNAQKEQVWKMLRQTLSLSTQDFRSFDASDALAVALCHYYEEKKPFASTKKGGKDWKTFLEQHPGRIVQDPKKIRKTHS